MQIVEVVWDDAHVSTSEATTEEAAKIEPVRTRTVAYLVAENKDGIVLATDCYDKDPKVGKIINFVPWGMIISYDEILVQ